jgi:chemotaxis protein methyltransferase CheR
MAQLQLAEFRDFQRLIHQATGVSLADEKRTLVESRLARRLAAHRMDSYRDYLRLLESGADPGEQAAFVDLLTTHETYFLREPAHFEHLARLAQAHAAARPLRVWSAACSTGEEPYSIAMTLADAMGEDGFEVVASDVSGAVLARAATGLFPLERARRLSPACLRRHCLRGKQEYAGMLLVAPGLRRKVAFHQVNLDATLPAQALGLFDVVFLRNVLIYFSEATRRAVLARVAALLRPGGHLYVGHAEAIRDPGRLALAKLAPAIYRKEGA